MKKNEYYVIHEAQYYETDQMKVVHHANYVKWMEESRNVLFKSIGININDFEKGKTYLTVLFQHVTYIKPVKYQEEVKIECKCTKLTSAKLEFTYNFYKNNEICAVGQTCHCFVNDELQPIVLKKLFPNEYKKIEKIIY